MTKTQSWRGFTTLRFEHLRAAWPAWKKKGCTCIFFLFQSATCCFAFEFWSCLASISTCFRYCIHSRALLTSLKSLVFLGPSAHILCPLDDRWSAYDTDLCTHPQILRGQWISVFCLQGWWVMEVFSPLYPPMHDHPHQCEMTTAFSLEQSR